MQETTRKGMGRRKVEIKRIDNKPRLHTTFTKRRDGLFKKGKELSKLCGAEAAIITITRAGNIYKYGNPSVESVIDRYLGKSSAADEAAARRLGGGGGQKARKLEQKYAAALAQLEVEKKKGKMIDRELERVGGKGLKVAGIKALGVEEAEQLQPTAVHEITEEKADEDVNENVCTVLRLGWPL